MEINGKIVEQLSNPIDELILCAKRYMNVPFMHAGRNEFGMDCIGLIIRAGRDCGLLGDYDNTDYSTVVNADFFRSEIEKFCNRVDRRSLQRGDLLLFSMRGTAHTTTHVGLYIGEGQLIHSNQSVGKVVIERLRGTWEDRLITVYRWKQWQH